jgi:hypothetical protein
MIRGKCYIILAGKIEKWPVSLWDVGVDCGFVQGQPEPEQQSCSVLGEQGRERERGRVE